MNETHEHFYEFEDFRLDRENAVLFRGDSIVDITPKSRELLRVLIEKRGQIVRKEELLAEVWPDSFVEEANLSHHIHRLRRALGEDSNGGKFIETVPKRGYRFIAPVVERPTTRDLEPDPAQTNGHLPQDPNSKNKQRAFLLYRWAVMVGLVLAGFAGLGGYWLSRSGRAVTDPGKEKIPRMETRPLTSYAGDELDSALSPDGKYTAFAWMSPESESVQIYVKQTDAGEPLKLSTNAARDRDGTPVWAPDGRFIAFSRASVDRARSGIYMVPAFGGPERRLLKVDPVGGIDWSADGKMIVYAQQELPNGPFALHLLDVETLETRKLTVPPAQSEGDIRPDFSPDGKMVSFTRQLQEAGDLYLTDLAGSTRRLTSDNRGIIGAAWAPDGNSIVYSSNRGGSFALWRLSVIDGAESEPLPINAERAFDPSISRTGNRLTFTYIQRDTNIWRVPAARNMHGQQSERLIGSSRRELSPNYSPDGAYVAYSSDVSGSSEIWMSSADGTNAIQLTKFGGGLTVDPRWSPDGKTIVFEAHPEGFSHLFSVSQEGGALKQLTSGSANYTAPSFSADGNSVYYGSDIDGSWQVWKMPAGGGDAVRVTPSGGYEAFESADGATLYFIKFRDAGIFKLDTADPSRETLLIPDQVFETPGEWTLSSDGIYIIQHHYEPIDKKPRIEFFSFETGKIEKIAELEKDMGSFPGLDLSSDGRWLIYSREDLRNHDISLVENFR
ncbi:MAG TPA: winged helix-turn-helix domain-containing protein [Pyrinomonadaceae bacterium]|nr:winged helix-turn-helix domain-containing protein [Pyrinomonadaceae bacterium]